MSFKQLDTNLTYIEFSDLILLSVTEIWMSKYPLGLTCYLQELHFKAN